MDPIYLYQGDDARLKIILDFGADTPPDALSEAWVALSRDGQSIDHEETLSGGGISAPQVSLWYVDFSQAALTALDTGGYVLYAKYRTSGGVETHIGDPRAPYRILILPSPLSGK